MRFITGAEAKGFFDKLGFGPGGLKPGSRAATRVKSKNLFYRSGAVSTEAVASALANSQGDFHECIIWPFDFVWGDRSQEEYAPETWETYAKWRRAHGEIRQLRDAPGHIFDAGEQSELARVLDFALSMGWDAVVAARPAELLVELSHNDRIGIHARSQQADWVSALEQVGIRGS